MFGRILIVARPPRFQTDALAELFRQLQYAPRETLARQMAAAETLLEDLDPIGGYPDDFIVWRITGYRSDRDGVGVTWPGDQIIGDLAVFVLVLSRAITFGAAETDREPLELEAVALELDVSQKSVQRYRGLGLVCHVLVDAVGRRRVICFRDALDRFRLRHGQRLDEAARFTRLGRADQLAIVDQARELSADGEMSLSQIATHLGREYGRSAETVRQLLRRTHDDEGKPCFGGAAPLTMRDGQVIDRAIRCGVRVGQIADHFNKTPTTIRRAVARANARRLIRWPIQVMPLPTLDHPDAAEIILRAPFVVQGETPTLPPAVDAALADLRQATVPDDDLVASLVAALNLLKRRVTMARDNLGRWPGRQVVDRLESDLRWASKIKRRLVALAIPLALSPIDQFLHRPVEELPAAEVVDLLGLAAWTCGAMIDRFDPAAGQDLTRKASWEMDRALAGHRAPVAERRARARRTSDTVAMPDLLVTVHAWDFVLDLAPSLRRFITTLDDAAATLIRAYYGLGSSPPQSLEALAAARHRSPTGIRRSLDASHRALIAARRL